MHVTGLSPLAIVLPQPRLPRVANNLPPTLSTPRTPRTTSSTLNILVAPLNRNSTDSWNSSNGPDEHEWDWKPEQVRLLSRTLDALPPHLVTPFIGPTPPSNLLDKIAHGVSQAKGPIDWPHSIRATRVKLIELSRARAHENQPLRTDVHSDHVRTNPIPPKQPGKPSIKRPLYRQSSMDFISNAECLKENTHIACLADRLQDRLASGNLYHPYSRRSPRTYRPTLSSPRSTNAPSLINPSTPSSSTLNSLSSFSAHNRILRRTSSNLSSTSASSLVSISSGPPGLPDPRIQRVRDSDYPPSPPPKDVKTSSARRKENFKSVDTPAGMKRAPSFGTLAQEIRRDRTRPGKDLSYPSSDEEEKLRTLSAKKLKVKDINPPVLGTASPVAAPPSTPATPDEPKKIKRTGSSHRGGTSPRSPPSRPKKRTGDVQELSKARKKNTPPPMNLRRNPSMFGPELPLLPEPHTYVPVAPSAQTEHATIAESTPPITPPKVKTLRRVRRLVLGRRISFGNLVVPGDDADGEADAEEVDREDQEERQRQRELCQLGSAFQLH